MTINVRPVRMIYTFILTTLAFYLCGTLAGVLMCLVQFDIEVRDK